MLSLGEKERHIFRGFHLFAGSLTRSLSSTLDRISITKWSHADLFIRYGFDWSQLMYRQFAPGVSFLSSLDLLAFFYLSSVFGAYRNHYWLCSVLRCDDDPKLRSILEFLSLALDTHSFQHFQIDTEGNCRKWRAKNKITVHTFSISFQVAVVLWDFFCIQKCFWVR